MVGTPIYEHLPILYTTIRSVHIELTAVNIIILNTPCELPFTKTHTLLCPSVSALSCKEWLVDVMSQLILILFAASVPNTSSVSFHASVHSVLDLPNDELKLSCEAALFRFILNKKRIGHMTTLTEFASLWFLFRHILISLTNLVPNSVRMLCVTSLITEP
jgi:hypothetical protein